MEKSKFNRRTFLMADDCCRTTEDGTTFCVVPDTDQSAMGKSALLATKNSSGSLWQKFRGGAMLGIGCVTSPCCTPLLVPLWLLLLAGTPSAVWLTQYIGWIYAGLTLISIVSLAVGWRWLRGNVASSRVSTLLHENSTPQAPTRMKSNQA